MGKYIVELKKNETLYKAAMRESDGTAYVCSAIGTPYTEPDIEQVRKEAYKDGYNAGFGRKIDTSYQEGLSDAWEAVKKLARMDTDTSESITGYFGLHNIMHNLTASEAIEKIRQYEQEKEEFHVGDEFENESGKRFVILKMDGAEIDRYIDEEGKTYCMTLKYKVMRKTGRHFTEIDSVLEKMREESNG